MPAGQGVGARADILAVRVRVHALGFHRALHVLELPDVEILALDAETSQKDIRHGLQDPLPADHSNSLAQGRRGCRESFGLLPPAVLLQHRLVGLLHLKHQWRSVRSGEDEQIAPRSDAADADHPKCDISQLEVRQQHDDVRGQAGEVLAERLGQPCLSIPLDGPPARSAAISAAAPR